MRPRPPKGVLREAIHTLPAGTLVTDVPSNTSAKLPGSIGEAQYRSVIDLLPQAVWIADPEGSVVYCNQYWCEFSGLTLAQTAEHGWVSILHPEDRPRALASWRQAIATGAANRGEYRFRRARDGEYRWHITQGIPLKDASGCVVQRVGIAVDIHSHKANETALEERDRQLHLAVEAARLGTWDYVLKGRRFNTSYRAKAMFGSPPDIELTYESFMAIVHPDDREAVREAYLRATRPNGLSEFEINYRIMRPDGAVRWIVARGKGVFSGAGSQREPVQLTGTVQDITEKKLAEEALRASEGKFRALIEQSSDAIVLLNRGSRVVYASSGTQRMIGYPLDDLLGMNAFELCHPESHAAVRRQMEECLKHPGQPVAGTARIRHKDGTWRVFEGVLTNLLHDPHVRGIVSNYRDITEKVQAEQALRDSEEKFRRAFRLNPDAMSITTLADGLYLDVNDAFLRLTAFTRQDVVGRTSLDVGSWVETEDRSRMVQALKANGHLESMETCFRKKTGEVFFVHLSAELIEIGNVQCVLATSQDITERKFAAEELRRSEEQHRSLIERAPYGICRITAEGRFLLVNPALVRMLGYEIASEVMALDVTTQVYADPEERACLMSHLEQGAEYPPVETRWKRKDGRSIHVRLAGCPIFDGRGRVLHSDVIVELVSRQ